jgi:hypothetical protein
VPTRKQRRRREKEKRHDYEYVYVDPQTGEELDVAPDEVASAKEARPAKATTNGKPAKTPATVRDARGRPLRKVQPPSWRRSAQRSAMFVVVLFVFLSVVGKHKPSLAVRLGLAVAYGVAAVPFFYWMDRIAYRRYVRVTGGAQPPAKQPPKRKR